MSLPAARMPAIFFGHGSPMNALERNPWTSAWRLLGASLPKPRAILAVSAHWTTRGTAVTAMTQPRTIHDFGGFPRELHQVRYPAPGDPVLAQQVSDLLRPMAVQLDHSWGLDHGTWSVLVHTYPQADIPVIQLSMDATQPPAHHYEVGRRLAALREQGVLIIGSGNVVHNLGLIDMRDNAPPFDWAQRFETRVHEWLALGEHAPLLNYASLGADAQRSIPTAEHFLPLLYVLGAQQPGEPLRFATEGITLGSISMMSVVLGP